MSYNFASLDISNIAGSTTYAYMNRPNLIKPSLQAV